MLDKFITFGGDVINAFIATAPTRIIPERKMTVTPIPGTSREVVEMEDAWEPYDQPYSLLIGDGSENSLNAKALDIASKLYKTGLHVLTDDYDTEHFRYAYFKGPHDIENRFTRVGRGEIVFRCMPERYLNSGSAPVDVASGAVLTNPTAYASKPLIKVEGSGNGQLVVAGVTITLTGITDYLYIDCEKQDVYRQPSENRNNLMTGSFPRLPSGNSTISFSGGITAVTITPRWYSI